MGGGNPDHVTEHAGGGEQEEGIERQAEQGQGPVNASQDRAFIVGCRWPAIGSHTLIWNGLQVVFNIYNLPIWGVEPTFPGSLREGEYAGDWTWEVRWSEACEGRVETIKYNPEQL